MVLYHGHYLVFVKTVQGSKGAPLTWARLAALIGRLSQAVIGQSGRLSTYVDDPLLVHCGTKAEHRLMFAIIMLLWSALLLPLSLAKASMGTEATWTSGFFAPSQPPAMPVLVVAV